MAFDMSHEIKLNKILREELKCHRCKSLPTLEGLERHRCAGYDNHAICKSCFKKNRNCPCGRTVNPYVCSITRKLFTTRKLPISCKFNSNGCQILHFDKVGTISKGSKVSIRDGTRNSSSLNPRGPGPFFTPRFPEE